MAQRLGTSLMAWSPLASGLLSGKYKPSNNEVKGEGRLATVAGSGNPAFEKFSDRNFKIVAELERVADHLGRSMAQVALNWVANQPGVSSVLIGATKVTQLQDNLSSLDFEIPKDLMEGLNKASAPEVKNPYSFFTPAIQGMIHGGASVGDKPSSYYQQTLIQGEGAGVTADAD